MKIDFSAEEGERRHLLYQLGLAMPPRYIDQFQKVLNGGILWIHFTDFAGQYDLDLLLYNGVLARNSTPWTPLGDWTDYFPPDAYTLTFKGKSMIEHPAVWVKEGKIIVEKKS